MRGMAALFIAVSLIASITLSAIAPARAETDAEIERLVPRAGADRLRRDLRALS